MTHFRPRPVQPRRQWQLEQEGMHPLLARLYAARGIFARSELEYELKSLIPPADLTHAADAASLLADAVEAQARILIVADYDCDGATACAVGVRALRAMAGPEGASIDYLVPNRFTYGYGLSPEIVELAATHNPDIIVTVDNGIASLEGVARANELGIATLITDHHLPGETLPLAECIVNPNQPGCAFPSKSLAGVGVMFYVMLALRAELRDRGWFAQTGVAEPNLGALLDLVALGTVADVVRLDHNNRILVSQGLKRIREGRMTPGLRALFRAAGRDPAKASSMDLGFFVGPRLNAAGRLADMSIGIEALITDDESRALQIAQSLDTLNRERKDIEADMQVQALQYLDAIETEDSPAVALFDPAWHQGRHRYSRFAHQGPPAPAGPLPSRAATPTLPTAKSKAPADRSPGSTCATRSTWWPNVQHGADPALRRPRHGRWAQRSVRPISCVSRRSSPRSPAACCHRKR